MNKFFLIVSIFLLYSCLAQKSNTTVKPSYKNAALSPDERALLLLKEMTIEEKVAQMRIFHANLGIENKDGNLHLKDDIKTRLKYGIAGIKNPAEHDSPYDAARLNNQLQKYIIENNRLGIPALFITESYNGVDAEGCTRFARPITMASSWNTDMVKKVWDCMGREARFRGLHMTHSPEIDIVRDPRFGRMSEAFGEDTHLVTEMAVAAVSGIQGDSKGLVKTHIGAVSKHFAGYGLVAGGKNFASVEISPRTLVDEIFPPFEAAVKRANTLGIMAAHNDLNGVACHGSYELLTEVLRNQWGFKGYVVSDANDIARLNFFMNVAENAEEAAILGLSAGMDVDLYNDSCYALLPELLKKKPELLQFIDRSALRMLRTKFILGLFENPYIDENEAKNYIKNPSNVDIANQADAESFILLKNTNNILPLSKNGGLKIGLLGPVLPKNAGSAFKEIAPFHTFSAQKGFELTDKATAVPKLNPNALKGVDKLVEVAKTQDINILFIGDDEYTAKEAFFNNAYGDRADIDLVYPQDILFERIKQLNKPLIVVLKHRRTLSINNVAKNANAILDIWEPSQEYEKTLAMTLFGDINPSGKLPVTVPRTIGQFPFHYSSKEINNKKGYLFLEDGPLYPFGYGLSYTSFKYENIAVSSTEISPNIQIEVSVDVRNTGTKVGKEVVQLYIKDIKGSVIRSDKELKAFQKIELKPGESKKVIFKINPEMLTFTTINMKKELEAGDYKIFVGPNSKEGLVANFKLKL